MSKTRVRYESRHMVALAAHHLSWRERIVEAFWRFAERYCA